MTDRRRGRSMYRITGFDGCSWCAEQNLPNDLSSVRHVETEGWPVLSNPTKELREHKLLSESYGVQLPPPVSHSRQ